MLFGKMRMRLLYLLAATALPPKLVESTYTWSEKIKILPQRKAVEVRNLSPQPILHGGVLLNHDGISVLSPDGSRILEYTASGFLRERAAPPLGTDSAFWKKSRLDPYRLQGEYLQMGPAWSVNLGTEIRGAETSNRGGSLVAWSVFPPQLFYLGEQKRYLHKIAWSPESEPVRFFFCDAYTSTLVENLPNGFTRVVFFRDEKPQSYTIFDFSGERRKSDLSAVVARNCFDFYFAGTFGLVKVRYDAK